MTLFVIESARLAPFLCIFFPWTCSNRIIYEQAYTGVKKQLDRIHYYTSTNYNVGYFYEDFSCQAGETLSMPIFRYTGSQDDGSSANVMVQTVICVKA